MDVVDDDEEAEVNFWPTTTAVSSTPTATATTTGDGGVKAVKAVEVINSGEEGGGGESGVKSGRTSTSAAGGGDSTAAAASSSSTVYDWETRRMSRKKAREDALITQALVAEVLKYHDMDGLIRRAKQGHPVSGNGADPDAHAMYVGAVVRACACRPQVRDATT